MALFGQVGAAATPSIPAGSCDDWALDGAVLVGIFAAFVERAPTHGDAHGSDGDAGVGPAGNGVAPRRHASMSELRAIE